MYLQAWLLETSQVVTHSYKNGLQVQLSHSFYPAIYKSHSVYVSKLDCETLFIGFFQWLGIIASKSGFSCEGMYVFLVVWRDSKKVFCVGRGYC